MRSPATLRAMSARKVVDVNTTESVLRLEEAEGVQAVAAINRKKNTCFMNTGISSAIRAQTEELKPMFRDLITCLAPNRLDQIFEIITSKEGGPSALLAKQKMFVPRSSDKRLASLLAGAHAGLSLFLRELQACGIR